VTIQTLEKEAIGGGELFTLSIKSLVPAADAVVSQDILKILIEFTHIF
jgi:hypothetical protein